MRGQWLWWNLIVLFSAAELTSGVLQGSVLSPLPFFVFLCWSTQAGSRPHDKLGLLWRVAPISWSQFLSVLIWALYKGTVASFHNSPIFSCSSLGKWNAQPWPRAYRWVTNLSVCVCAMISVGPGVRWPAHPPPMQHAASQVQKTVGAGEDPAHPLHREPLHQGELWLLENPRWGRPHCQRRLWWGLSVW